MSIIDGMLLILFTGIPQPMNTLQAQLTKAFNFWLFVKQVVKVRIWQIKQAAIKLETRLVAHVIRGELKRRNAKCFSLDML